MFKHDWIFALCSLRSAEQVVQSSIELTFPKFHPAETIKVGSVVGFALQRASDHCFSFVQIHVVIRPHVTLSLIHISEPTRLLSISYAVFCLKKKKKKKKK